MHTRVYQHIVHLLNLNVWRETERKRQRETETDREGVPYLSGPGGEGMEEGDEREECISTRESLGRSVIVLFPMMSLLEKFVEVVGTMGGTSPAITGFQHSDFFLSASKKNQTLTLSRPSGG